MALPKTDAFTASNGTALPTYNAGYVNGDTTNTCQIQGNEVAAVNNGSFSPFYWTGDTFNADHSSEAKLDSTGSAVSVCCQGQNGTYKAYSCWLHSDNNVYIYRHNNSTAPNVAIASAVATGNATTDVFKIWIVGTAIHASKNGVEIVGSPWTDANLSGGSAGGFINDATGGLDDWTGDNVGGGGGGGVTLNVGKNPAAFLQ